MKRMLSVILSMVLLVSSVVIPMSVNATENVLTKEAAYNAVMEAVNNLELDFENVVPKEYAIPSYSYDGSQGTSGTDYQLTNVSDLADKATLGSKTIELLKNKTIAANNGVLLKDHLHVAEYTTERISGVKNDYLYFNRIGYLVVYVKSARPFKMSIAASNGQTQNINFLNGTNAVNVPATTGDNYTRVVINFQSGVDWTSANRLYTAEYRVQKLHLSVQAMTNANFEPLTGEDNTIKSEDHITFGSVFYVPVDYDVRDFKYDAGYFKNDYYNYYTGAAKNKLSTISTRYKELSAEMIAAAEKISNDDGHYTSTSFKKLQDAITAAKKALFLNGDADANVNDFVTLFKNEVENLYKLEEVFVPSSVNNSKADLPYSNASEINNGSLSAAQQKSFGEKLFKVGYANSVTSNGKSTRTMRFTAPEVAANTVVPNLDENVKYFNDYRNLYLAVENTGDSFALDYFTSYNTWYTAISLANDSSRKLRLESGYNLINLYDVGVERDPLKVKDDKGVDVTYKNPQNGTTVYPQYICREKNILFFTDYMAKYSTNTFSANGKDYNEKDYIKGSNVITLNFTSIPETANLYIGSIIGEKPFDTTGLEDVNTKANVIAYYNTNIKDKGYINTDDIEKTFSALGLFKIPVTGLYNPADIDFTGGYTFDAALPGETLTFKINKVPADVDVTVTYDGEPVDIGENDVYELTEVAENKQLVINLSHITTEFAVDDTSFEKYFSKDNNNLSFNKDPVIMTTKPNNKSSFDRDAVHNWNVSNFSNGTLADTPLEGDGTVGVGFTYRQKSEGSNVYDGDYYNRYKPYENSESIPFDFDRSQENDVPFDAYTDIIYDLGYVADINKVQHFARATDLSLGAYEVFVSDKIENLFDKSSSVIQYQNKTKVTNSGIILSGQQHEFTSRSARFVAFRVYCPIVDRIDGWDGLYARLSISELAIYGTKPDDVKKPGYTVSTAKLETLWIGDCTLSTPEGTERLLKDSNVTVSGKVDGKDTQYTGEVNGLHDTHYGSGITIKEFTNFNFRDDNHNLKNGYKISRNYTGKINFTRDSSKEINTYLDFTYSLDDYYNVSRFDLYSNPDTALGQNKIQAYRVYIGNDFKTLYSDKNMVVDFENYLNTAGQRITFDKPQAGKYIGLRILMPGYETWSNWDTPKLSEIAAFGKKITDLTNAAVGDANANLKPADCDSGSVFIFNQNGSSVYKKDGMTTVGVENADNSELRTSMRLSLGYKCPVGEDGKPQADKILLEGGGTATIVERNIIAAVYNESSTYDNEAFKIDTAVQDKKITTVTGNDLKKYFNVKENDESKVYCTLNVFNIKNEIKDRRFVVRGRIVYKTDEGKYYCFYTPVFGDDEIVSAQNAYDNLSGTKPTWFKAVPVAPAN